MLTIKPTKKTEVQDEALKLYDARTVGEPLFAFEIVSGREKFGLLFCPTLGEVIIATGGKVAYLEVQRLKTASSTAQIEALAAALPQIRAKRDQQRTKNARR